MFEDARIRVDMNGLMPLVMAMEMKLLVGEVNIVKFEYARLEKYRSSASHSPMR